MGQKATGKRTSKEETISIRESDLFELIQFWTEVAPSVPLSTGPSVKEAMARGLELRRAVASGDRLRLNLRDQSEVADVLHASCRSLMDDCAATPRRALDEASAIREVLENALWPNDDLEEKESILCSLAFIAWRAARILDLPREANRWEAAYRQRLRLSLDRGIPETVGLRDLTDEPPSESAINRGAEEVFQTLLYLQEDGEAEPQAVNERAQALYRALQANTVSPFSSDLRHYFLGESARVASLVLRFVAPEEASEWLDTAEDHFRAGVNPEPQLARVLFIRLTLLYVGSRCDLVIDRAPDLDSVFSSLGMEEDRIKCRFLWAGSLKLMGRCQEALAVLEPVRRARHEVRPALFGWVLLQSGDIHQMCGDHETALQDLLEAARLFRDGRQATGLADVYSMISCIYRAQGRLDEAVSLLETGRQDHARLGLKWPEAYHRILIAETYLAMGRPREAEIEIRAALPIIEEQGMLADAVIAVNLLREAVRQRKLDPADNRESFKPKT